MKYISRYHLGLEQFLVRFSGAFQLENMAENYAALLLEQPLSFQLAICREIQAALHQLVTSEFQVRNILPANLRDMGEAQFPLSPSQVAPFFHWLQKLHRDNVESKHLWESALDEFGRRFGGDVAQIFRSLETITFQRFRLEKRGEDLLLSSGNLLWGEYCLTLKNVQVDEAAQWPQCGYLFWAEGEVLEEGGEVRLLMDREFSDTVYHERLLQSRNWWELTVRFEDLSVQWKEYDYTKRALTVGLSSWDAVRFCCYELIHKATVMGETALSAEERRLWSVAQLFLCTGTLDDLSVHPPITFFSPVNVLDNRYQFSGAVEYLRKQWPGDEGEYLCDTLEEIQEAYDQKHRKKYPRALRDWADEIGSQMRSGGIRLLAQPLKEAFAKATENFGMDFPFGKQMQSAADTLQEFYHPLLRDTYHFEGEFPHYYRLRGNRWEFFSFVPQTSPVTRTDGKLYFTYAVQLARCPVTLDEKGNRTVDGLSPAQCRASDFQADKPSRAHFAIAGDDVDGMGCLFAYPLGVEWEESYHSVERKYAAKFGDTLILAVHALDQIPIQEKKVKERHRLYLKKHHTFRRLWVKWLSIAVILVLCGMVPGFFFWKNSDAIIGGTILLCVAGVIFATLAAWLSYGRKKRHIWNRDKE